MIIPQTHHPVSWLSRPGRFLAGILALSLAIAVAERLADRLFASRHGAQWIWADGDYDGGEPIAFLAVREVELPAPGPGRITIAADETYLLSVNGRLIGSGSYLPGAPFDVYDVGDFLAPGVNRILIELSSSRGAGGLLAELELGAATVVTDDSWRIFRREDAGLAGGGSKLLGGEAPRIWGRPPTGRWRLEGERRRPILLPRWPPPESLRPVRHQRYRDANWQALDGAPGQMPALGPLQVFDWGEQVEGYLAFDLSSELGAPGLLYVSAEPPDSRRRPPDAVVLSVPGRRYWQDAQPRRFRYALLVGVEPDRRIEVLPGGAGAPATSNRIDGVFGIEPPHAYSEVERRVWSRLDAEAELHVAD